MNKRLLRYILVGLVLAGITGCETTRYRVIASTGTNIGVEISQNPATQVPQAKLGYQRAELALVGDVAGESGGTNEVADVLMEMRYRGIFSWGENSGIYQRLAVGKTAVSQPGAALMFARADDGSLDSNTAKAASDMYGTHEKTVIGRAIKSEISTHYMANEGDRDKIKATIQELLGVDWNNFLSGKFSDKQLKELKEKLESDGILKGE